MGGTILVTGATGTNGKFLVERLATLGSEFQVMTRSQHAAEEFTVRGIKSFVGDFALPETLAPALAGVNKLFLLSVADPRQVELQGNMIEAAQSAGVRHVVKLSAGHASPDSRTSIKRWHYETEQQIIRSGIPYTFLRPNGFMQNSLNWRRRIREQGFFYMPVGDAVVSQVDARDIAAVAAAVLTRDGHEGQTYHITGPEALSYEEVAQHLSSALNKDVRCVRTSFEESCKQMIESGMEAWLAEAVTQTYRFLSEGGAAHSTDVVVRLTGTEGIPFSQYAADYAGAFRPSGAAGAVH